MSPKKLYYLLEENAIVILLFSNVLLYLIEKSNHKTSQKKSNGKGITNCTIMYSRK